MIEVRSSLLCLLVVLGASACVYKNERFNDGDTWVVRSTFVMKCTITKTGWSTTVIGCKTARGMVVEPGKTITEGETTYQCVASGTGRVEIKRTYDVRKSQSCEGHAVGETWVAQKNFKKECTPQGARIMECLTDVGIPVKLNGNLVLSGISYSCHQHPNGTVSINRESVPNKSHYQVDNLLQSPGDNEPHATPAPIPVEVRRNGNELNEDVICTSNGKNYKAEDTWISENKFTKKCTPDGAVIILNCLIDDQTTINVNSQIKIGKKTYKCYRSAAEGRVFLEVLTE